MKVIKYISILLLIYFSAKILVNDLTILISQYFFDRSYYSESFIFILVVNLFLCLKIFVEIWLIAFLNPSIKNMINIKASKILFIVMLFACMLYLFLLKSQYWIENINEKLIEALSVGALNTILLILLNFIYAAFFVKSGAVTGRNG